MKEITPKNITLQEDDAGDIWLIVPDAAINLWYLKPMLVRKAFLRWAENQLKKQTHTSTNKKKETL